MFGLSEDAASPCRATYQKMVFQSQLNLSYSATEIYSRPCGRYLQVVWILDKDATCKLQGMNPDFPVHLEADTME